MGHLDKLLIAASLAIATSACRPRGDASADNAKPAPQVAETAKPEPPPPPAPTEANETTCGAKPLPTACPCSAAKPPTLTAADEDAIARLVPAKGSDLLLPWEIGAKVRQVEDGLTRYVGEVSATTPEGTVIECHQAEITADADGRPASAVFSGNVHIRNADGTSMWTDRAEIRYNDKGVAVSFSFPGRIELETKR